MSVPIPMAAFLVKWLDLLERFLAGGSLPILQQFLLVERGPLDDKSECSGRKSTGKERQSIHVNECLLASVESMEVRRIVVIPVHLDHNAKKPGYFRHAPDPAAEQERFLPLSFL